MLASEARRGAPRLLSFVGPLLGAAAVCAGCVLSFDGLTGGARPGDDAGSDGDGARPDTGADGARPDTGADGAAPGSAIFSDTFDGPSIDSSKWIAPHLFTETFDPALPIDITAQRLRIRILSSTSGGRYSGVTTKYTHDLTGARVSVRLAVRPGGGAGALMSMALGRITDSSAYAAVVEDGIFAALECLPGKCELLGTVPAVAQDDMLVAIRHDVATDDIVWEIAPPKADGPPSWSELNRTKRKMSLADSSIELKAGTYASVPNAGFAAFDDVLVER